MALTNPNRVVTVDKLDYFRSKMAPLILGYVEAVTGSTPSKQLTAGKHYVFGTVTSVTVTFASAIAGVVNEYTFEFDSGSTAATLNVPNTVVWQETPSIKTNKHYEVSIKYNATTNKYYGIICEF